jgi:hypothetical protein
MSDRDTLIEQVAAAWRPRDVDGALRPLPAWHDLDEPGRHEAFRAAVESRQLEAALDSDGLSTTAHAVLARIRRGG